MTFFRTALLGASALIGSFASAPAIAQQSAPAPQSVQTEVALEALRPALWLIADEDTTIYLFGTIHALPPGKLWLDGKVLSAFEGSDELVTEIPSMDPAAMQAGVLARALLPADKSLRGLMSAEHKLSYEQAMVGLGLPVAAFDRVKPWFAAVTLATLPLLRDGYSAEAGVEATLEARAKALSRPHTGLETVDYQLSLFDTLPLDVQTRYLADVVKAVPTVRQELDTMVDEWGKGQADKLAEMMTETEDDPALKEVLLTNRNRNWAVWIKERLAKPGKVFLAVGAGHLAGEGSVQDQLIAQGITTARVQ